MATIKKVKKAQTGEKLPEVTITATKKPTLGQRIFGTPEKRAERKEEREGRRAERQSNREVRKYEREDRRRSRCTGSGCAQKAGFGGYNKNGGVTKKAKTGMKIKKKMQAGGISKKSPKAPMVDPQGAWTKVQERTLGNMEYGGMMKAKDGKWIQKAIKKPGALRKSLGAKKGEPIPAGKLAAAAKKPGKLGQRARLAQTLKKMKKK